MVKALREVALFDGARGALVRDVVNRGAALGRFAADEASNARPNRDSKAHQLACVEHWLCDLCLSELRCFLF